MNTKIVNFAFGQRGIHDSCIMGEVSIETCVTLDKEGKKEGKRKKERKRNMSNT